MTLEITVEDPETGLPLRTTLFDLVQVVQQESDSDLEVVATLTHIFQAWRIRSARGVEQPLLA